MTNLSPQSRITNVKYVAPPEMQEFIRQLILDNAELRAALVSVQSQLNLQSRRR